MTVTLDGASPKGSANAWILTGESLLAESVGPNGQRIAAIAGGPFPEAVVPYSIRPSAAGNVALTPPPASVASLVIY